jgi:hypothetical protein
VVAADGANAPPLNQADTGNMKKWFHAPNRVREKSIHIIIEGRIDRKESAINWFEERTLNVPYPLFTNLPRNWGKTNPKTHEWLNNYLEEQKMLE